VFPQQKQMRIETDEKTDELNITPSIVPESYNASHACISMRPVVCAID
jgi:hypothetical protein